MGKMGRKLSPKAFADTLTQTIEQARTYNREVEENAWRVVLHVDPPALKRAPARRSALSRVRRYIKARLKRLSLESSLAKVLAIVGFPVSDKGEAEMTLREKKEAEYNDDFKFRAQFNLGSIGRRALDLAERFVTSRIEEGHEWRLGNVIRNENKWPLLSVCVWRAAMEQNVGLTWNDFKRIVPRKSRFQFYYGRLQRVLRLNAFHRLKELKLLTERIEKQLAEDKRFSQREAERLRKLCMWLHGARLSRTDVTKTRSATPLQKFFGLLEERSLEPLQSTAQCPWSCISSPVMAATAVYLVLRTRPLRVTPKRQRGKMVWLERPLVRPVQKEIARSAGVEESAMIKCKKTVIDCMMKVLEEMKAL